MQSLQTPRSVTESVTEEATPLALLDAFESDAAGVRQSEPTSSRALEFGGPEKEEGLSAPGPWLLKPEEAEDQAQACVMSTLTAVAVLNNADANGGTLRSVEDQQVAARLWFSMVMDQDGCEVMHCGRGCEDTRCRSVRLHCLGPMFWPCLGPRCESIL
eukprot:3486677-Rhodomonas_salina.1